jgi:hypothetical protein
LTQHATKSQEDENCEREENDGVDIEHVSHAFGYRGGTSAGSLSGLAPGLDCRLNRYCIRR